MNDDMKKEITHMKDDIKNNKKIIEIGLSCSIVVLLLITAIYNFKNNSKIKEVYNYIKETNHKSESVKTINKDIFNKTLIKEKIARWIISKKVWKDGKLYDYSEEYAKRLANAIVDNSKYPVLVTSIIYVESRFNPTAKSYSNAVGLGQISLIHIDELMKAGILHDSNGKELYDVCVNVKATNFILDQKLRLSKGDIFNALKLYSSDANDYSEKISKSYLELMFYILSTETIK